MIQWHERQVGRRLQFAREVTREILLINKHVSDYISRPRRGYTSQFCWWVFGHIILPPMANRRMLLIMTYNL